MRKTNSIKIDCTKAEWFTDELNEIYKDTTSFLCDVDWIIETNDYILMIEYKNGTVYPSKKPFNPTKEEKVENILRKFYDSLHYFTLVGKEKKKKYFYVLEFPNDDPVIRKFLRNEIGRKLPIKLQQNMNTGIKLIESFDIFTIAEWNEAYPDFPITRTDKPFKVVT